MDAHKYANWKSPQVLKLYNIWHYGKLVTIFCKETYSDMTHLVNGDTV